MNKIFEKEEKGLMGNIMDKVNPQRVVNRDAEKDAWNKRQDANSEQTLQQRQTEGQDVMQGGGYMNQLPLSKMINEIFEKAWTITKNTNYSVYNADKTTRGTELKPLKKVPFGEQARGSKSPANVKRHDGASNNGKLGDKRDKNMGGKAISNVDKKLKQRERV